MPDGRILTRASLGVAVVALALSAAGLARLLPAGGSALAAALLAGVAALLALAGARESGTGAESSRSAPAPSARAAFGPALDGAETLAVCTVDRRGRIGYWNAGAARLFGRSARDVEGALAAGIVVPADEEPAFRQELETVFSSGRAWPARRSTISDDWGRRVEAAVTVVPLLRYGKVVEAALVFLEIRAAGTGEKQARLLDATPAGLLALDGEGRIEAVNQRLAEWTGRRVLILEEMEITRADLFPPSLRGALATLASLRRRAGELPETIELDETLLDLDGVPRPVHVVATARPGGGADVVLLDGASRRQLLSEVETARSGLAEARRAAADAIESTTRELHRSAEEVADAVRRARDDRSGPVQRARAEVDLAETTREFLKRVEAARAKLRPTGPFVLLVEDNDENRELLAHMLRSRGAEVVTCGSGREALEAAARQRFSFVLLDLQMPEMDGYQVVRRLRALPGGGKVPVVALTALTSESVRQRCEAEGMSDFVTKPVTLARIRELVDRWGAPPPV